MRFLDVFRCLAAAVPCLGIPIARAADEFERAPIEYSLSAPANRISRLQARLDRGEVKLPHEEVHGYLPAVLDALGVPIESQMLVFSKTSFQQRRISPRTPRAIYFSEDVYVGYCDAGDVLEVSAADPQLGTVFYTLDQQVTDKPRFQRQVDNCLICHNSSRTEGIPGHLVRSLFVDSSGQPIFSAGGRMVDHTTPLAERWGGWYVTGKHGSQPHLGNLVIRGKDVPRAVDNSQGQNVIELQDRTDIERYLSPHSDIVALMVLEHQTFTHNRLTKANFAARQALHYEATMNRALGNPAGTRLDSTRRRIESAGDELVDALLMVGEAKLTAPISGTSGYAETFARSGLRDAQGRSLRDLDLAGRLLKYPCSYLIYSPSFDGLPNEMRDYVWQRLWQVLSLEDHAERFAHLSHADRQAIVEILRDTKPALPEYWRTTLLRR